MDQATYPKPRSMQPGTAWVVVQYRDGEDAGLLTGIHHADVDCPAVRVWADAAYGGTRIIEVERATGARIAEWTQTSFTAHAAWQRNDALQPRLDLSEWRSCLRCGSSPEPASVVCQHCFLTICDCTE